MMETADLLSRFKEKFPEALETPLPDPKWIRGNPELQVSIPSDKILAAADFLKNQLGFDFLNMVTAVDWIKNGKFELVYHFLKSDTPAEAVFVRADLPREGAARVASLASLWDAANWQEREVYDLFGIQFDGHPDLRRILLWEGYPGHPLRKDYIHIQDKYDNGSEIGIPKSPPAAAASVPGTPSPSSVAPPPKPQ